MATPKSVDRIQELLALHEAKKKDLIGLGLSEEEKVAVRDSKKVKLSLHMVLLKKQDV